MIFVGVVRLSQVLGLGAVEMRAFDCMWFVILSVGIKHAVTVKRLRWLLPRHCISGPCVAELSDT